ncbi:MAG: Mur ligase family protein, partial [Lysobacterales bacterium]
MSLALVDSRRLTGANLFWDSPSAVIDVRIPDSARGAVTHWELAARDLLVACGQGEQQTCHRNFDGGASLLISSPIDALYSMCELNEVAWDQAVHEVDEGPAPDMKSETSRLRALFAAEKCPRLLQLEGAARKNGAPFLWDSDEVSVGYGSSCRVWPAAEIADPAGIDWTGIHAIPLVLVTGTNGKSTSVRMVADILQAADYCSGLTSTDFIRVDGELIEAGDYSGPSGARTLLRHPRVGAAVLELARGGLLRRGLGVERADAALVTNVAADHLGEYGINSVKELIEAKFIVRRALGRGSPLVLNADDEGITEFARALHRQEQRCTWWFSEDAGHPLIREAIARGEGACWLHEGGLFTNAHGKGNPGGIRPIT